jgi:hypothetical protein
MEDLLSKIDNLIEVLKKANDFGNLSILPKMPEMPKIKPINSVKVKTSKKTSKLPNIAPDAKKDPKKIAQQIKDGSMTTRTQKLMLKSGDLAYRENGQWYFVE